MIRMFTKAPQFRWGCLLALLLPAAVHAAETTCPALLPYYPTDATDEAQWQRTEQQLVAIMSDCLLSAEYFALYGAALLNNGNIDAALEALERALLLDPNNGAALIDYAETLYIAGQLFPAIELNSGLLGRQDLPPNIRTMLESRQSFWEARTRNLSFNTEVSAGYDTNLNGAPLRDEFALTLAGDQVVLTLAPDFQRVGGEFLNLRVGGNYRRLTPERTHDLVFALRNRVSEHQASELLQLDWRYALSQPWRNVQGELVAGTSHLLYGGSPLYTISEARTRLRRQGEGCQPQGELAALHQLYHGQSFLTAVEASVTGGVDCVLAGGAHQVSLELGPLINVAINDNRPGDDRDGWRLNLGWQFRLGQGQVNSLFSYGSLDDDAGYDPLLANNSPREVDVRLLRVQYFRPLGNRLTFMMNFSHQNQGSNIAPFASKGTALDFGLRLIFP